MKTYTATRRIFILQLLAAVSVFFSLFKGSTSFTLHQLIYDDYGQFNTIFLKLRLPRTITAFTSGGLLALSGSLMQLLLQNPLADPYVLGISSGAAFFTLLLMLAGASGSMLLAGAWAGSMLTAGMIVLLGGMHRWQMHALLLCGIAIAGGFGAGISLILLLSPDASLHSMLFWLTGDLNDAGWSPAGIIILIAGTGICWLLAPGCDILGRGDQEARALGLPVKPYRIILFSLSSLFAAAAVVQAGCIGFAGLIVPHFARRISGYNHRLMLPAAVLLGGSLVVLADTLARTLFAPQQIPVGIVMAVIGIPIFIFLMRP
ncbi:MAG TPA: iron ABC transporter permease [Gammaproteobacteria bacterium]|nr:iron ABC transporter permease [Gammaproteobacteria bacterium]